MPPFEVRIAASPTRGFYGQIALFAASLQALGYAVPVRVFLGADEDIDPIWNEPLPLVELVWVHGPAVYAQCDAAFIHPARAPILVYSDADTVWLRRIDELIDGFQDRAIAGLIAHMRPPGPFFDQAPELAWAKVGSALIGRPVPTPYRATMVDAALPFYVNLGFVVADARIFAESGRRYLGLCEAVSPYLATPYFKYQAAVPVYALELGLSERTLDPEYNFINDETFERLHSDAADRIRVIHYAREKSFARSSMFDDPRAYGAFLEQPLTGVERLLQDHVRAVWPRPPAHLR